MIPCPPAARWPDLLADELPADLGAHLDSCPHCQSALEASWADARRLLAPPAADERAAVERLKRPPDTLDAHDTDEGDDAQDVLDRLGPSAHPGALGKWGPYDVLAVRGRGGMGVVLRAYDAELNREVALKVQAPRLAHGAAARKRFRREAVAAAAVRHENVVPIHAVAEFAGLPYLVMEYVDGPTLQERIDQGGPLPVDEVLRIGAKLAAGLAAAHAAGLVHRDLKPANVLQMAIGDRCPVIGEEQPSPSPITDHRSPITVPKIADFGLARAADDPSLTATGVLCGTPAYMAPEQIVGDPVDWRADLYGLGGTLYALAAGRPPHAGATKLELLRQVCDAAVPPLRSINPNVPVWLEEIVMTLLAKEPARRYPSAAAVGELLAGCLAHHRTGSPLPPPLRRPPSRRLRFATLALVACALAAGVVVKLQTPDGTLVVEIDDPTVKVKVDGSELVIAGAGVQELRVKPGPHTVTTARDGKPAEDEVVTVTRGGKQVVRVKREGKPPARDTELMLQRMLRLAQARELAGAAAPHKEHDAGVLFVGVGETKSFQPVAKKPIRHVNADPTTVARVRPVADDATKIAVTGVAAGKASVSLTDVEGRTEVLTVVVQAAPGGGAQPKPAPPMEGGAAAPRGSAEGREFRLRAAVASLAFTPDGKRLVAGAADGTAYVWDLQTPNPWLRIGTPGDGPVAVAVSPDGSRLVIGGRDNAVACRALPSGDLLWTNELGPRYANLQTARPAGLAFTPDGKSVATAGAFQDGAKAVLLDAATGKATKSAPLDSVPMAVAIHPSGDVFAVGLAGGQVVVVPIKDSPTTWAGTRVHPSTVTALAFAPAGTGFVVAYGDQGLLRLSPTHHDQPTWDKRAGPQVIHGLAFVPGSRVFATTGLRGAVQLWDMATFWNKENVTPQPLATLSAPGAFLSAVAFSPDGRRLAAGGDDKVVRLWEVPAEALPAQR